MHLQLFQPRKAQRFFSFFNSVQSKCFLKNKFRSRGIRFGRFDFLFAPDHFGHGVIAVPHARRKTSTGSSGSLRKGSGQSVAGGGDERSPAQVRRDHRRLHLPGRDARRRPMLRRLFLFVEFLIAGRRLCDEPFVPTSVPSNLLFPISRVGGGRANFATAICQSSPDDDNYDDDEHFKRPKVSRKPLTK